MVGGIVGRLARKGTLAGMFDGLGSVGSRVFLAGLIVGAIYGLLILAVIHTRRRLPAQARHEALQRGPRPTTRAAAGRCAPETDAGAGGAALSVQHWPACRSWRGKRLRRRRSPVS